jgi:hypothetical protein
MNNYTVDFNNNGTLRSVDYVSSSNLEEFEQQLQTELEIGVVPFETTTNTTIVEIREV